MDDILDIDWVLSHETQIEEKETTLFLECASEDLLLIGSAMLYENKIPFKVKLPKTKKPTYFTAHFQEIHIHEKDFEKANTLLELLLDESLDYPKRLSKNYQDEGLKMIIEVEENPYREILIKIELKRRGIEFTKNESGGSPAFFIAIIFIIFFVLLSLMT